MSALGMARANEKEKHEEKEKENSEYYAGKRSTRGVRERRFCAIYMCRTGSAIN